VTTPLLETAHVHVEEQADRDRVRQQRAAPVRDERERDPRDRHDDIQSGCTYTYRVDASSSDTVSSFSNLAEVKVPTSVLDEKMSLSFEVHQNYPNPFNSSTSIIYEIPWETNVRLIVYDLLGREIAQLVNEKQPSGKYTLRLDARDLPSGSYFYLLQTKDRSITRKFTILK
jgi:hypothetical protein